MKRALVAALLALSAIGVTAHADPICDADTVAPSVPVPVPTCDPDSTTPPLVNHDEEVDPGIQPGDTPGNDPQVGACMVEADLTDRIDYNGGAHTLFTAEGTLECFANVDASELFVKFQRLEEDGTWNTLANEISAYDAANPKRITLGYHCYNTVSRTYRAKSIGTWQFSNGAERSRAAKSAPSRIVCKRPTLP